MRIYLWKLSRHCTIKSKRTRSYVYQLNTNYSKKNASTLITKRRLKRSNTLTNEKGKVTETKRKGNARKNLSKYEVRFILISIN